MNYDESTCGDRRDFNKLVAAAFSGLVTATTASCASAEDDEITRDEKPKDGSNPLLREPHVCRGLNTCKNKGGDGKGGTGKNACAGQGACHTAPQHGCSGQNDCRGLGACDEGMWPDSQPGYPGENTCKGKGGCQVPLLPEKEDVWRQARNRFKALMADAGKKAGTPKDAPKESETE